MPNFNGKKLVDPNELAYSLGNAAYALDYNHLKFKATDTELVVTTGFNDKLHVDLTKCKTIDDILDQINEEPTSWVMVKRRTTSMGSSLRPVTSSTR